MILINGYFFCRRLTGVERYAYEITRRLDRLSLPGEISLIVPGDLENIPEFKNIKVIRYKKTVRHIFWQFIYLQYFLFRYRNYIILDFGNTCLPFFPGIVFLHDIYCEVFPKDLLGFRDRIACLYNRWQYRLIARKAKKICTVSEFSRNQIASVFNVNPSEIEVIYSGWNHFSSIDADYSVMNDFPALSGPFYFSLGSLSKRKNIGWIIEYARKNPNDLFAVSGTAIKTANSVFKGVIPGNVIFVGYLSDAKVKALMEKCEAFILPSYYEGFGLTPLEALSTGAKIIISKTASLPEIYGNTARYIDPYNTDISLDELLKVPVEAPDNILKRYSYDTSAKKVYAVIKEFLKK